MPRTTDADTPIAAAPGAPVAAVLRDLAALVERLDATRFVQRPVGPFASSIGEQVRHCHDHARLLLAALDDEMVDYDRRERGAALERDPRAAAAALLAAAEAIAALDAATAARPLRAIATVTVDGARAATASSVGRELCFVQSHTVHHNAMIAAMARLLGVDPGAGFGVAPSTLAALDGAACAR